MPRVVVLGSSNTDMTVRLPRLPSRGETILGGEFLSGPGGKGANQAVAARRAGAEVLFLTAVGDDDLGRRALDGYRREGIDVAHARIIPGVASGVALIFVGDGGENMIGVAPGANARLTPEDIDHLPHDVFTRGGVFLASLEVPLDVVVRGLRRARDAGMITVLNPAPAPPAPPDSDLLALADVLTPNRAEALSMTQKEFDNISLAVDDLRIRCGANDVVVTLGDQGCLLAVASDRSTKEIEAFRARSVDTVGAGDAFNGALAVALGEGRALVQAATWANAAAALAVTRRGAQEGMPTRGEIDRLAATVLDDQGKSGDAGQVVAF
jgi:ribokinase